MEYEVDSYTLEHININGQNKYYLSFKDSVDQDCKIEIEKEIFDAYMTSRKAYTKIKNETSRHLEHLPLSEIEIYNDDGTIPVPYVGVERGTASISYTSGSNIALNKTVSVSSSVPDNLRPIRCVYLDLCGKK